MLSKVINLLEFKKKKEGGVNNIKERIQKSALPQWNETLPTIHIANQMSAFIPFCPLCHPRCGGTTTSLLRLSGQLSPASSRQPVRELQHFLGSTGPFHSSLQTGSIGALAALIRPLSWSIWMEPQTRDAQKRSWLLALLQLKNLSGAEGTEGWGMRYFQRRERCSQKISQIWGRFISIQNQLVYLQQEVGGTGIDCLGFERSYSISKSSG